MTTPIMLKPTPLHTFDFVLPMCWPHPTRLQSLDPLEMQETRQLGGIHFPTSYTMNPLPSAEPAVHS